jgi:hypothetical protein
MTTQVEKPALRQSSILMFLRCQPQYFFRYEEGLKIPARSHAALGSSFHKTTETNYTQKVETYKDMPTKDLEDLFAADFSERALEVEWTPEERTQKVTVVRGKLIDTGRMCVRTYQGEVAPTIQPARDGVEWPFRVKFDNDYPYDLAGTVDLITNEDYIIDHKTAGKSPDGDAADRSLQLTLYALAYRAMTQRVERGLRLDHVVKTKQPKIVRQQTTRTDRQIPSALTLIGRAVLSIEHAKRTGTWLPPDPTKESRNWWCSENWCGYWHICEFGGKK